MIVGEEGVGAGLAGSAAGRGREPAAGGGRTAGTWRRLQGRSTALEGPPVGRAPGGRARGRPAADRPGRAAQGPAQRPTGRQCCNWRKHKKRVARGLLRHGAFSLVPPGAAAAPDRPSSGRCPSSLEAILDPASQNGFFLFDRKTGAPPRPRLPAAVSCRPQRRHRRKARTNTCSPLPATLAFRIKYKRNKNGVVFIGG